MTGRGNGREGESVVKTTRDELFASPLGRVADFDFGRRTAEVFDDMLDRSVPFYEEIQHMCAELVDHFAGEKPRVYDLGCSTGTSLALIAQRLAARSPRLIGLDSSPHMLEEARSKLAKLDLSTGVELRIADLDDPILIEDADAVLMNLTLQFVRPLHRERLLRGIFEGLEPGGCFILIEKVTSESSLLHRMYVDLYHDFKARKGYSDLEISQKREALENVLIPYRISENEQLLRRSGFELVDMFFRWYNFAGFIAVKSR